MKPQLDAHSFIYDLVATWWTPIFIVLFVLVIAYALWPRNRSTFDKAARMPLRED
jgi:cytochrome c oxidase cbb3-type subunit 4